MNIYFSFKEIFSAFIVLFAVIDILGSIPIILALKAKNKTISAEKAAIFSFVILVAFLFVGNSLLALFNVDISSFAMAGALVIFVLAVEMIFGIEIFKNDGPTDSATLVPLVFPLIAGAASFTTLLSLRAEYNILNFKFIIRLLCTEKSGLCTTGNWQRGSVCHAKIFRNHITCYCSTSFHC